MPHCHAACALIEWESGKKPAPRRCTTPAKSGNMPTKQKAASNAILAELRICKQCVCYTNVLAVALPQTPKAAARGYAPGILNVKV